MSRGVPCLRSCLRSLRSSPPLQSTGLSPAQLRYYASSTYYKENLSFKSADAQQRWNELRAYKGSLYPRAPSSDHVTQCRDFLNRYENLKTDEILNDNVTLCGRISSFRIAGPRLVFLDIVQDNHKVQGVCSLSHFERALSNDEFSEFYHLLRRGDHFSLRGKPHRTHRGELSVLALELPKLLAPCLHQIPTDLQNQETRIRNRHVDFLVNRQSADILHFKSDMIDYIRTFLRNSDHVEVQTPMLEACAGGAIARPFQTASVEFADHQMNLRIAPELWLKRLIIGGFDRVFEIGSCFRNEGLDMNHNPEFISCEIYRAYADLESLIGMTETLLSGLASHCKERITNNYKTLVPKTINYSAPFRRLNFVTEIESAIKRKLPDLVAANAEAEVLQIFQDYQISLPDSPNLPALLGKLSSTYLEPQCSAPTFIVGYPECMSPLAKSFVDQQSQQRVAACAELFIDGQEIVNMYEEENSPFEQRRKFDEQLRYRGEGENPTIDESYLQALEWGLPPTGGWGCGIERLCMLMSGAPRIGDVLSFGSLRNVVRLGRGLLNSDANDVVPNSYVQ